MLQRAITEELKLTKAKKNIMVEGKEKWVLKSLPGNIKKEIEKTVPKARQKDTEKKVQEKYPSVIAEITGRGLMQGIQFSYFSKSDNIFLRTMYLHKLSGYLFSAYLLRKHNIQRVLEDPKVKKRCKTAALENKKYEEYLKIIRS